MRSLNILTIARLLVFAAVSIADLAVASNISVEEVNPSEADHSILRFDQPNLVIIDHDLPNSTNLVVFLPGTNGAPRKSEQLLSVVAQRGYRVLGLEYNNAPAVIQICPHSAMPSCSAAFRQERVFGDDSAGIVDNTLGESIVGRLVSLLRYLNLRDPQNHWDQYLIGSAPNWSHIVISGFSQGAGMAAYIAKRKAVARVVLFSGPWDFYGSPDKLAPWIYQPSATPPERWFAALNSRENTASSIARAYKALGISSDHIRVLNLDLLSGVPHSADNPYHTDSVRDIRYKFDWIFLIGQPP